MPRDLLERLEEWKRRFGTPEDGELERLLQEVAASRFADAGSLIRLHETLLFLRAYPRSREVAGLADSILFSFGNRVAELRAAGGDLAPFEEPEVSGIAGTSFSAVFSYEVARRLAALHGRSLDADWVGYDTERLGPVLRRFLPLLEEDWPVEAHVPFLEWIHAARPRRMTDLEWLLACVARTPGTALERADLYERLELPLLWNLGNGASTRSRLRVRSPGLFIHSEPLLRRSDVSLGTELERPPLPLTRLTGAEARRMLDLILDTSAMRYRELYGFTHPETANVVRADAGRGVEIVFFGVPPQRRLPLRAYHAGMFFKNGVPAGYIETLSLFERAEVGFNLYYTFREGESAWIYTRLLRLLRQLLGVTCFSVDPYQIGHENEEGIDSGAFWFYRKLGFRPVEAEVVGLLEREERAMVLSPGQRSSRRALEKLARGYVLYEAAPKEPGAWDRFRVRNVGLVVQRVAAERFGGNAEKMRRAARVQVERELGLELRETGGNAKVPHRAVPGGAGGNSLVLVLSLIPDLARWTPEEKQGVAAILHAKQRGSEARYLHLMQRHARLRAAFVKIGSRREV